LEKKLLKHGVHCHKFLAKYWITKKWNVKVWLKIEWFFFNILVTKNRICPLWHRLKLFSQTKTLLNIPRYLFYV
jgi:hypothetical protein